MKRVAFFHAASVLAICAFLASVSSVFAQGSTIRVVLKGHDPVAYFIESKPVKGDPKISYDWDGERYLFSNAGNRDKFAANPERYAPQFSGYCTGSMSKGVRNEADPEAWIISDGRLYLFGAVKFRDMAEQDRQKLALWVAGANEHWRAKK